MSQRRIIVTGDIPRFAKGGPGPDGAAPCDATDLIAMNIRMPWGNVTHLNHRPMTQSRRAFTERLQELHSLPNYVAAVALHDIETVLPSATDVFLFDLPRHGLQHIARRQQIGLLTTDYQESGTQFQLHHIRRVDDFLADYPLAGQPQSSDLARTVGQ
jgi:hypothetical protein